MTTFDNATNPKVAADLAEARRRAVESKYMQAIAVRHAKDSADAARHLAHAMGQPVDEVPQEAIDGYVEHRALARSYFTRDTGIARDLPTGDAAVHALDVAAARAHVAAAEAAMEEQLGDRVLQQVGQYKVEPQVLKDVAKYLKDGNTEALQRYVLLSREVPIPGGGRATIVEMREWCADTWPVYTPDELRQKFGVARQTTLAQLVKSTRFRQHLEARGGIVSEDGE